MAMAINNQFNPFLGNSNSNIGGGFNANSFAPNPLAGLTGVNPIANNSKDSGNWGTVVYLQKDTAKK